MTRGILRSICVCLIIVLTSLLCLINSGPALASRRVDASSAVAKVLEFNGPVKINDIEEGVVSLDMFLTENDTLTIAKGRYIKLLFNNGTIKQFDGPATISIASIESEDRGNIVERLASAVMALFFSPQSREDEVFLVVRDPSVERSQPLRVPKLISPPPSCSLIKTPSKLKWQPIEGVFNYSVMLFDDSKLLWQGKANDNYIELPVDENLIKPGIDYLWVVNAEIGGQSLRSEQGKFSIIDHESRDELYDYLSKIEDDIDDQKLLRLLKARAYREYDLKLECYKEIEAILYDYPGDYSAYLTKAELLEEMGLLEEAVQTYKAIINR